MFDLAEKNITLHATKQIVFLVCLFVFKATCAATSEHSGIDKLVAQADVIAVGEYSDISSGWDKKKIYTSASFKVDRMIKGDAGKILTIKVLGGTAIHPRLNTPITMNVSNGVSFVKGKKSLVFLKKNNNSFQIVGMSKGNISIVTDDSGLEYMGGGIKKIDAHESEAGTVISSKKMSLDEFIAYITSLIQQQNKK